MPTAVHWPPRRWRRSCLLGPSSERARESPLSEVKRRRAVDRHSLVDGRLMMAACSAQRPMEGFGVVLSNGGLRPTHPDDPTRTSAPQSTCFCHVSPMQTKPSRSVVRCSVATKRIGKSHDFPKTRGALFNFFSVWSCADGPSRSSTNPPFLSFQKGPLQLGRTQPQTQFRILLFSVGRLQRCQ